jgi:hypothetical protein
MTQGSAADDQHAVGFFGRLARIEKPADTFRPGHYRPAPDDWCLVVTDIENSTAAVGAGQHKTVNFVAATAIAAVKNLCAPMPIPFLFGGDGSVVMLPLERAAEARLLLARLRGFAAREFGLRMRAGLVGMRDLRGFGVDVLVGRYEPLPGNSFGVFMGGGVGLLESAVKGHGIGVLATLATIPESLDDGDSVDLSGLSCRWQALRSTRGKMLTLIIQGTAHTGEVYAAVMGIAGSGGDPRPARPETLAMHWPPTGFMLEARARKGRRPLLIAAAQVLAEAALVRILFARDRPLGAFDPRRYRQEVVANTDFCKQDQTLSFVIDCPSERIDAVRAYLDERADRGELRYGMHLSDTALMTCIVTSPSDGLHVHFIDGGDGGYTAASRQLKAVTQGVPAGAA